MIRKQIARQFLGILALGLSMCLPLAGADGLPFVRAVGDIIAVAPVYVGATQQQVGYAAVEDMMINMRKRAVKKGDGDPKKAAEFFKAEVRKITQTPIPAYVLSDGASVAQEIRIVDGHHRACIIWLLSEPESSLYVQHLGMSSPEKYLERRIGLSKEMLQELSSMKAELKVAVQVKKITYSEGELWREILRDGKGQFAIGQPIPGGIEALDGGLTEEQALKFKAAFPKNMAVLGDFPARSAVGTAFFSAGLDAGLFNDYIEFKLAEHFSKKIILLPNGKKTDYLSFLENQYDLANNPLSVEANAHIQKLMFEDQAVVAFLMGEFKGGPDVAPNAKKMYLIARKNYFLWKTERGDPVKKTVTARKSVSSHCSSILLK